MNRLAQTAERGADFWTKKYPNQMEALCEDSLLKKVRGVTTDDICSLGEMLEQFESYSQWVLEAGNGTAADLGKLPQIALDVIAASYGTSIVPLIASVQPIEEEKGIIYFREVRAGDDRGNVTANQLLRSPIQGPDVLPIGYANELLSGTMFTTVPAQLQYTHAPDGKKYRPGTFRLNWTGAVGAFFAQDDQQGNIVGYGMSGVINYNDGSWTINFMVDPNEAQPALFSIATWFEQSGAVPKIRPQLTSTDIQAEIWTLGTEIGFFKAYSLQKRFGKQAEEEMTMDLTNEMVGEMGNTAVNRLVNALNPAYNVDWAASPAPTIAWYLHKQELKDKLAQVEAMILTNAGRGSITHMIAGSYASAILSNLPGFRRQVVNAPGPQVFGDLDGIPVIRCPATPSIGLATNKILCVYKGTSKFDAALVYSPYMPLFVSNTLPVPNNVLMRQGFAAAWAGMKIVAPRFIAQLSII